MISGKSPIDMTSLVTRVARYVGVMENAEVIFLPEMEAYIYEIGLEHFVQEHMMREGPGNSTFMCYPRYDREIELPCPRLSLYSVKSLTLQMEKREPTR
jgi:phage-related protein